MSNNHEEDEFIAVRVQDPRIQNEGSWNSHVDYKIFLHTNSKAFTAKTSCVRRRYSEFAWLKKKLQKNCGLVPVPDLPGKSLFSFSNEDFLERRRNGLQVFLDKVLHMTVCLSDSQLHLFLQTQLPVGHIQDCVQGHTPYTVTDAILTYASSNQGFAQAQEDDSVKEPSLTVVPYESMESPAPHLPSLQNKENSNPGLLSPSDQDTLEGIVEVHDRDKEELQFSHTEKSSLKVLQKNNHLEAIVEQCSPADVTFFLGDFQDNRAPERPSPAEQTQLRSCQIQTPVEVHSPVGTGFEDSCGVELEKVIEEDCTLIEESLILDTENKTVPNALSVPHPDTWEKAAQGDSLGEAALERVSCEPELPEQQASSEIILEHVISEEISSQEQVLEPHTSSEEELLEHHINSEEPDLEDSHSEKQVLEQHVITEVQVPEPISSSADCNCPEETQSLDGQTVLDTELGDDSRCTNETTLKSEISEETLSVSNVTEMECGGTPLDQDQVKQQVDLVGTSYKVDSDEDSQSLLSSNGSIAKVSDNESICDEKEDFIHNANGYMKTSEEVSHWSAVEASSRGILELQMNGCPMDKEDISDVHNAQEKTNRVEVTKDEELPYMTNISTSAKTLELESTGSAGGGDLTDNSDFNILESNCESADGKCTEQVTLSSLSLDASGESQQGEVH